MNYDNTKNGKLAVLYALIALVVSLFFRSSLGGVGQNFYTFVLIELPIYACLLVGYIATIRQINKQGTGNDLKLKWLTRLPFLFIAALIVIGSLVEYIGRYFQ